MKLERSVAGAPGGETMGDRWNRRAKEAARASNWRPIVLGLVVLAALVAIVVKFTTGGAVAPEAAERPRELEPIAIEGLAPRGRVLRSEIGQKVPLRFRWQKIDSASYYFVRIFGPGGVAIDMGQVIEPRFEVRESKRDLFLTPGEYAWEVTAYTADARALGRSERTPFTIE